jgi:hypothetical protein
MAKRFTFSTKDLLFLITLLSALLAWYISDRNRIKHSKTEIKAYQAQADKHINEVVKLWGDRTDARDKFQQATQDRNNVITLEKENQRLRDDNYDLRVENQRLRERK